VLWLVLALAATSSERAESAGAEDLTQYGRKWEEIKTNWGSELNRHNKRMDELNRMSPGAERDSLIRKETQGHRTASQDMARQRQDIHDKVIQEVNRRTGGGQKAPDGRKVPEARQTEGTKITDPKHRGIPGDTDVGGTALQADKVKQVLNDMGIKAPIKTTPSTVEVGDDFNFTVNKEGKLGRPGSGAHQTQVHVDARNKETYVSEGMDKGQAGRDHVQVQDHKKKAMGGLNSTPEDLVSNPDTARDMVKGTSKTMDHLSDAEISKIMKRNNIPGTPQDFRDQMKAIKEGRAAVTPENAAKLQQASRDVFNEAEIKTKRMADADVARTREQIGRLEKAGAKQDAQKLREGLVDSLEKIRETGAANKEAARKPASQTAGKPPPRKPTADRIADVPDGKPRTLTDVPSKGAVVKGVAAGVVTGVVAGAAVSYIICMEEVGDHAVCMEAAKEAMSGQAIAEEVFWGAVVASGPAGVTLAAAYGAYHGTKQIVRLGEEGVAGIRDLLARERERRAREAQQQKNLKRMEELIAGLEAKVDGEMAAARNRYDTAVTKAQNAAQSAEQAAKTASNLHDQLKEVAKVMAGASVACKEVEQLLGEVASRAANAKRYAERVKKGIEEGWKKVRVCQSTDEINEAVRLANAAKPLAQGIAQNYRQAEEAMERLDRIKARSEQAKRSLERGWGVLKQIATAADSAAEYFNETGNQTELAKSAFEEITPLKAALLQNVSAIRGAFPDDAVQVNRRLAPLVERLQAKELAPAFGRFIVMAERGRNRAQESLQAANALLAKPFPLCEDISLPKGQIEEAARAMADMYLEGVGEGIEKEAKSCLARLKPSKEKEKEKAEQAKKKEQERVEEAKNRATAVANEVDALYADAMATLHACDFQHGRGLIEKLPMGQRRSELERELRKTEEREKTSRAAYAEAKGLYGQCNYDEAVKALERASALAPCSRIREQLAEKLASVRAAQDRQSQARALFQRAKELAKQGNDQAALAAMMEARERTLCEKSRATIDAAIAKIRERSSPAAQVAKTQCAPNSRAYWDEAAGGVRCACAEGLEWNSAGNACVLGRAAQVARAKCAPNSSAYWDTAANDVRCRCADGYEWNGGIGACVSIAERQREMEWWQAECTRLSAEVAEMESLYNDHETGNRLMRTITLPNSSNLMYDRIKSLDREIKRWPKDHPEARPLTVEFTALWDQYVGRMNQLIRREADLSLRGIRDLNALIARSNRWKSLEARYPSAKAERDRACEKAAAYSRRSFQTN
jgi:hypothetical protein